MNRKQRKARLKHLNAMRKQNARYAMSKGFMYRVTWATWEELEKMRDQLEYDFAWIGDTEKTRQRLNYIEDEMAGRKRIAMNHKFWANYPHRYPPK